MEILKKQLNRRTEMKDEFLRNSDDNVIALDHASTLLLPRIIYQQSVADCRVIGAQIANLITFLHEKLGADMKTIHLIGHSLGAHIAGYAGERLPNLGRITGLDPAGPYFRNVANNVKLDTADATFVDVIHSNPSAVIGFGTNEDLGHINFWPNGGKQRGCPLTLLRTLFDGILPFELQTIATCPHRRSIDFFVFSFNQNDCLIVGVECTGWSDFLQGKCNCGVDGQMCSPLGVFAKPKPPPRRRYYLKTAGGRPFCLHQYQVIVYLQTVGNVYKSFKVPTQITIFGDNHFVKEELIVNTDLSIRKQINTFLVTSFQRIGKIQTVEVSTFENFVDVNTTFVVAVEINYLYPKPINTSESRFCRPPVIKEDALKKNIVFSSHHCHSYQ
ncbi:UNVERIFIED_CONTAM: Pnlip [Trichonephila clavipes]